MSDGYFVIDEQEEPGAWNQDSLSVWKGVAADQSREIRTLRSANADLLKTIEGLRREMAADIEKRRDTTFGVSHEWREAMGIAAAIALGRVRWSEDES